jgi:hypothetical protein
MRFLKTMYGLHLQMLGLEHRRQIFFMKREGKAMFELYFPENKAELIPYFFEIILVALVAYGVTRLFMRLSQKELEKARMLEEKLKATHSERHRH